jgi:hypothetical protein
MLYVDPPQPEARNIHVRKRGQTRCSLTRQLLPEQWNDCLPSMLASCHSDEVVLSECFLSQDGGAWLSLFRNLGFRRICGGVCTHSMARYDTSLDVGDSTSRLRVVRRF